MPPTRLGQSYLDGALGALRAAAQRDAQGRDRAHQRVRGDPGAAARLVDLRLEDLESRAVRGELDAHRPRGIQAQVQLDRIPRAIHLLDEDLRPVAELDAAIRPELPPPDGGTRPGNAETATAVVRAE